MSETIHAGSAAEQDAAELKKMGYEQELHRHMGGFSNFAISFSIICILAGGISAFNQGLGAGGGFSLGVGWPVGGVFALVVAMAMAQIASAYPTAGGLYHWGSILGGKGYGWVTAWFNLLGLIFVVASVNFGVYDPFFKTLIAPMLGIAPESMGQAFQIGFIAIITIIQAILNAYLPKLTTKLTDISGYLIFAVATALVVSLLAFTSTPLDFSKLFTFTNFTGTEGSVWPKQEGFLLPFLSGLLFVTYTITGFDASAHTSEETRDAANNVPKGIIKAVIYSAVFGFIMVSTFVLVMPNLADGVKQGYTFFDAILHQLPNSLRILLSIGIFVSNFLCGLACLTSCSRMMFAFSRDGGLPFSSALRKVHGKSKTPINATWTSAILAIAATLYGDAFLVLATGSAVFLYISYVMPTAAGLLAEGKNWKHKGPFNLGGLSKPIGVLAVLGGSLLAYVGMQPPNEKVLYLTIAMLVVMGLFWYVFGESKRFKGPPTVKE
ncbi:amino acid permease [Methylotenera versatilis]|uniref:Amino acid permease-associated region n=1 Tax=Methylotenera versatilis (strain 301) TaxID=666681 RepID=D7DP17_METV0|nr:amino acid permease [Methylotenera versatilis]ADI31048.1 amino acid permease-associated region [Methylotenera versatilis 301]